ncbi:helix-turn-helix transcriptional regulator [Saccharibacillus sp. CPCC 101409]|uniref:helix-turn-helix domain-containing protein n=1 Tax=Saccharibacillus sp. CPCC 101409 TaxID=3058041 RepID=UPI002670DAC1|nr:helix-turn-helix transcriptional regulator [Saccharibacillus sp. CPCC 101409]MDO3410143.1 helix-turn-helix transcriptional regulator [Saccharibacillus sp. CPCC 101409]
MNSLFPLRLALQQEIKDRNLTFSDLAKRAGLNRSVFSLIFRKKEPKPIAFQYLTKITLALGYPEDHYFELYIDECFYGGKPNRSRIEPFLIRCAEQNKQSYIRKVLFHLSSEHRERSLAFIFEIAERLVQSYDDKRSTPFFQWIIDHETDLTSERLAVAHFRMFRMHKGTDEESNSKLIEKVFSVKDQLPDELKLTALLAIINAKHIYEDTKDILPMCEEFIHLCIRLFGTSDRPRLFKFNAAYPLIHPPIYYYGQSHLLKEAHLTDKGDFEEAALCQQKYKDLSWLAGSSEIGIFYVRRFNLYYRFNEISLRLLQGQEEALTEYVPLLIDHPPEILPGIITMLDAACSFQFNLDDVLDIFKAPLHNYMSLNDNAYNMNFSRNRYVLFLQKLSVYQYNRGRYEESLQAAMQSWELSQELNNHSHLRMFASLAVMYNTPVEET